MSDAPSDTSSAQAQVRAPRADELERVRYLFGKTPLSPAARFAGMLRLQPIERFIAAAAWWPQENTARFQLACQPGVARTSVAGPLLNAIAEAARQVGLATLRFASPLAEDNEWFQLLHDQGFQSSHSERSFEVSIDNAWARVSRLYEKHRSQIPGNWRAAPIRGVPPEKALELVNPHRLMPPAELLGYWQANSAFGFELDLSCVLFDGERALGALLFRRFGDALCTDVRVMREPNPRLRSLGNLFMMYEMFVLYHEAVASGHWAPVPWLRFRAGAAEHRETASLALRMGGRERARAHLMIKPL